MEFPYIKSEGEYSNIYRPYLPITFGNGNKKFPVGNALVDTGSDFTILPLDVAHYLEIELDDSKQLIIDCAGGGRFKALPSRNPIEYVIEKKGFRKIRWEGTAYFTEKEPMILLGHEQCLEKFDITFYGQERKLQIIPRFKI